MSSGVGSFALVLDGIENGGVHLVLDAHGFQGQEHLAVGVPGPPNMAGIRVK
jgi:hypothetical protein